MEKKSLPQHPLVCLKDITKTFLPNTLALKKTNVTIYPGKSIAIIGPSGSGKSTLLSLLGLLDTPTSGEYFLDGKSTSSLSANALSRLRKNYIGYIFQSFNLINYLTVEENILHCLAINSITGKEAHMRAQEALQSVQLEEKADAFPEQLSGGQRQRVAIARAIATRPRLLLCDEPTGNLDTHTSDQILSLLLRMVSPQSAVLIVTHNPAIAQSCDERIAIIDGIVTLGQSAEGTSDTVIMERDNNEVSLP